MTEPGTLADLRKPFPPAVVGQLPKGNTTLDYVGHAAVTDRLLTVDPAWTWEPVALDETGLPLYDKAGGLWIKLTILGVTRLGYGDGPDPKQRIGDAIRNAAMRFGVALDLWTKDELESQDPNGGGGDVVREQKAQRSTPHPVDDPWMGPPVTDPKWATSLRERTVACTSLPILKGLYSELASEVNAGHVADTDAADLKALLEERAEELKAAESVPA